MPKLIDMLSQDEINTIIKMYQDNFSIRQISVIVKKDRASISKMLESLGVKTTKGNHYRKYFFDFDFFEKIDTEEKAY